MKKEKYILYIDDDADDRENFGYALEKYGGDIKLTTATDAYDALDKLSECTKPMCIYLDINMPKMNGLELLQVLKSDRTLAPIPVIIFSTCADAKHKNEAIKLGAAAVVPKPSSLQALLDQLHLTFQSVSGA